jgi:hypothetical protein
VDPHFPEDKIISYVASHLGARVLLLSFAEHVVWVYGDNTARGTPRSYVVLNGKHGMRRELAARVKRTPTVLELDTYRLQLMKYHV